MKFKTKNIWNLLSVLVVLSLLLTACGTEVLRVSQAFCVAKMSRNGNPMQFYWPEQVLPDVLFTEGEYYLYIPCNYRNYIVDNRGVANQSNTTLGDTATLFRFVLPSGVQVDVGVKMLWQVNQGPQELAEFVKFAAKYDALKTDMSSEGNTYSSTDGWNNMLLENVWTALDSAGRAAMSELRRNPPLDKDGNQIIINDDMWRLKDDAQWEALGNKMSELFADELRSNIALANDTNTATPLDLVCGSGAPTGWVDSDNKAINDPERFGKPGTRFNCSPVRIEITIVEKAPDQVDTGSQSIIEANAAEYEAAYERYHEQTDCWMGILDSIKACGEAGRTCNIYLDPSVCTVPSGEDASNFLKFPNPPSGLNSSSAEAGTSATPEATPAP